MGGDYGPEVIVPAAQAAIERNGALELILVGDKARLQQELSKLDKMSGHDRLHLHHTSQQIYMDESPMQALREKKRSSMRVALDIVKSGEAGACVSSGNTGALVLLSHAVLRTLPGVERTAIISALPTLTGHTYVLDLGANVDSSARHLYQFAVMGSILARAVDGDQSPTVGLLNIGAENIKGNEQVREAAQLLSASTLNYTGFVENIYSGAVDVVICDGFVGNVALKTSEGVAQMFMSALRKEFSRTAMTRLMEWCTRPVMQLLSERMDPRRYNGASLLGMRGIVVKSHGGADVLAFGNAIDVACAEIRKNVPALISEQLEQMPGMLVH